MRTIKYSVLMLGVFMLFVQCRSDDYLQAGRISLSIVDETLVIENHYGQPISYFAVESDHAARSNWAAASGEHNTIMDEGAKSILWSEIASGAPVQPGDRIIIYWWPAQTGLVNPASMKYRVVML